MRGLARREFIRTMGLAGAGAMAFSGFASKAALLLNGENVDYGPLKPVQPNNVVCEPILELPKDFQYTVIGIEQQKMHDGNLTPNKHDGMAAFEVGEELRLVRNHEVNHAQGLPGRKIGPNAYDENAGGGTTTLIIDPQTRECTRDFVSLSGTAFNCAGGPTLWGSWISCEETVLGTKSGFTKPHGYCFEVPANADKPVNAVALSRMGRFKHEAVAIDPQTGYVYLTEDSYTAAGFYRFRPSKPKELAAGGTLEMLKVHDKTVDPRTHDHTRKPLKVTWVEIDDPNPHAAEENELAVHQQGINKGGSSFLRLEGCLYANRRIYFDSTNGGKGFGQVWEYDPEREELTLVFIPTDMSVLHRPDNLCADVKGRLIICEDNDVGTHIRILGNSGPPATLARNVIEPDRNGMFTGVFAREKRKFAVRAKKNREFAGVTFSPDFKTLFVNIQEPGLTLAIWGPW